MYIKSRLGVVWAGVQIPFLAGARVSEALLRNRWFRIACISHHPCLVCILAGEAHDTAAGSKCELWRGGGLLINEERAAVAKIEW